MDVSTLLEAGLQANAAAGAVLDIASTALDQLTPQIGSDCCGSNNYPEPPPPTLPT